MSEPNPKEDKLVHHPKHYTDRNGIECIDVSSTFDFNKGCAIKYIWRCEDKVYDGMDAYHSMLRDLNKAIWYLRAEICLQKALHENANFNHKDVDQVAHFEEFMEFFVTFLATTFENKNLRARLRPDMTFQEYLTLVGEYYLDLKPDTALIGGPTEFPLPANVAGAPAPVPTTQSTYRLIEENGKQMADVNLHFKASPDLAIAIMSLLHHAQVMTERGETGKVSLEIQGTFDEVKVQLPPSTHPFGPKPLDFKKGETVFNSSTKWAQTDTEGAKFLYGDDVEVQDMAVFHKKPANETPSHP